jgi:hypothetical protein
MYFGTLFSVLIAVSLLWSVCAGQSFSNGTNQQQAQWCDGKSGMCMAINIPSASAPDYYLAITAPQAIGYLLGRFGEQVLTSSWAAVGIGSQMPHSLMFIIAQYNGNVTLSIRTAESILVVFWANNQWLQSAANIKQHYRYPGNRHRGQQFLYYGKHPRGKGWLQLG